MQYAGLRQGGMVRFRANNGFTLLEVLLAFVVFALSFTIVMEILTGSQIIPESPAIITGKSASACMKMSWKTRTVLSWVS